MKFKAEIDVMPQDALLDPQGKAVANGLKNIGLSAVENVRVGKHVTLLIDAADKTAAEAIADEACRKLLANPVMEAYRFTLVEQA
ncbi:MAG: phosphoribosylformylglycinamidine synthase subunit PurS [Bacteroidia bacterium]|nr:phosphoribosylformylglycinamidine synthase subunit PurS [Bacteroidia bacterium]